MFDVHPPHGPIHGWRDFSIQLITITVGLLIALLLEGSVEWLHHRHLMHEAEASLLKEIKANAAEIPHRMQALKQQQGFLAADIAVLDKLIAHPDTAPHEAMTIQFDIIGFDNVSWNTAQATGAVTYMPYEQAQEYSDIYTEQSEIDVQVRQTMRDMTISMGPFVGRKEGDSPPSGEDAKLIKRDIQTLEGQLYLLEQLDRTMDEMYKKFTQAHPG